MFKILIPAVAALSLLAVGAKTQAVAVDPADAPSQTMAWHLSKEGDMAKLAYGIANSDDLAMMVTCAPGESDAEIYGSVHPVSATLDTSAGMPSSRLPVNDPALRDLAHTGAIRVSGDQGGLVLRASASERRGIGQFLTYCSQAAA